MQFNKAQLARRANHTRIVAMFGLLALLASCSGRVAGPQLSQAQTEEARMMPRDIAARIVNSYTQAKWDEKPFVCESEYIGVLNQCEEGHTGYIPITMEDVTQIEFGLSTFGGLQATLRVHATSNQKRSGTYLRIITSGKLLTNEDMTKILQAFTAMGAKL